MKELRSTFTASDGAVISYLDIGEMCIRDSEYIAKYTEATGFPADITTLVYYDCAMLMFEAAAATGGDSEAIIKYLREDMQGYEGLTGVYNFDERGLGRWEAYLLRMLSLIHICRMDAWP